MGEHRSRRSHPLGGTLTLADKARTGEAPVLTVSMDNRSVSQSDSRLGFYGRRKGHRLRSRQAELFETLLPKLALDLSETPPADVKISFPVAVDAVHLNIGFGGGEQLIAEALANPRIGFIGCEPFINGMAKALAAIETHKLTNIRLHSGDASEVIDWLPPACLDCVDLLYPDPWPKRRHWKRRFIQDQRLVDLARILRAQGRFRFATDIADYAAWTLVRFLRSPDFIWMAERADDWRNPWPGFAGTRYEAKAIKAGRMPCYLVFCRQACMNPGVGV